MLAGSQVGCSAEQLTRLPVVRSVRQEGLQRFVVVVEDAGTVLPDVVQAVGELGGEVVSAREERPSFDEVFALLVERGARDQDDQPSIHDQEAGVRAQERAARGEDSQR